MKVKQRKIFYTSMFFLGLILIIWEVEIYRKTIIDWYIPSLIILFSGILAFYIDFKNFKETYKYVGKELYLYSIMHYFVGFGFIVCSIFMLTNYYLSNSKYVSETYKILDRTELPSGKSAGKSKPAFIINYKGKNKELVFYSEYLDSLNYYSKIQITSKKGFLGFDIITQKKLK
jgi:hypothetical protein